MSAVFWPKRTLKRPLVIVIWLEVEVKNSVQIAEPPEEAVYRRKAML